MGSDYLHINSAVLSASNLLLLFKPANGPSVSVAEYLSALGLKPLPFTYSKAGLRTQGMLNGHSFTAAIGSGFRQSFFSDSFVKSIGEATYATGAEIFYNNGVRMKSNDFNTASLQFGAVTINPQIMTTGDTDYFKHIGCDFIMGHGFLAKHNAVINFGSNTLWMKSD